VFGTYATTFNTKVTNAVTYTTVAGNADATFAAVSSTAAAVAAITFTLTTGGDVFTGSTANDTFRGSYSSTDGMSLTSDDTLDGGAGTDLLNATVGEAVIVQPTLSNIETVKATFSAAGTVSLLASTGVTSVVDNGSTVAAIFTNIGSASAALTAQNTAIGATFGYTTAALSGSADNVAITLSNMTAGTLTIQPSSGTNGAETITITSSDSANTLSYIDDGTSTSLTKLVINGAAALTLGAITPTTVTTVDASAFTAALTIIDTSTAASTITGGSGNDSITMSNNVTADSIVAGAGDDTVTFGTAGNFTGTDTVTGGDGKDTLIVTSADAYVAAYPALTTPTVTGFEVLRLSTTVASTTGTITTTSIDTGITTVTLAYAGTNAAPTINFGAGSNTLNIGASSSTVAALTAANLTVDAAGSLGTDSLTIKNNNAVGSAQDALATAAIVSTDFETVTVNTGSYTTATDQVLGAVTITGSAGFTSAETLVLTGANRLTLGIVTADVIDASAMTASTGTVLTLVTGTTATTITGSAGNDVLISDVALAKNSISGGAGDDAITGGTGNDTLLGGAGNDTITGSTGNDSIDGGAGNDRIVFALTAELTSADNVKGGDATDTLAATGTALTDSAAVFQAVSGFEILELSNTATQTVTMSNFINNSTFTEVHFGGDGASGYALIAANAPSTVTSIQLITGLQSNSASFDRLIDSSSNSLTVNVVGDLTTDDVTSLTIADEETVTIAATLATSDLGLDLLTAGDLKTLTITGAGDVIIDGVITSTVLATVNASGSTGAVTLVASSSVASITATAGTGVFTFTGGLLGDAITGGTAADALLGGAGADTIDGGAGSDAITGGTGADSMTGGSGVDTYDVSTAGYAWGVAASSTSFAGATVAAGDSLTFGNGVDVITDFTAGTGGDILNVISGTESTLIGETVADLTAGAETFIASGSWVSASKTFVIMAAGTGTDTMVVSTANATVVSDALTTNTSIIILVGVDTDDIVAGNIA